MTSKLNVTPLLPEFVCTLYDAADPERRIRWTDVAVLYCLPVAAGVVSFLLGHDPTAAIGILTLFVVISGFLLNVTMQSFNWIIAEHRRKIDEPSEDSARTDLRIRLMTEIHQTVAYGLVVSLIGLGVALPVALTNGTNPGRWRPIAFAACVALGVHLGLTLVIVAKRMTRVALNPPEVDPATKREDQPGAGTNVMSLQGRTGTE